MVTRPRHTRWCLVGDPDRAAGSGGRGRFDHLGRERRLHGLPGPSARGRCPAQQPSPAGAAWRQAGRTRRPWPGPVPRGLDDEDHLACEQGHRPLSLPTTSGQRRDSPQFRAVLEVIRVPSVGLGRPRVRSLRVRGDTAYASRANRAFQRGRGILCTIPEPADQAGHRKRWGTAGVRPPAVDRED